MKKTGPTYYFILFLAFFIVGCSEESAPPPSDLKAPEHKGIIAAVGDSLTACGFNLSDHGLCGFTGAAGTICGSTEIVDHDLGTALGKFNGVTAAEALPCARYDGDFAVIANCHTA
jgi:hypothetical protein